MFIILILKMGIIISTQPPPIKYVWQKFELLNSQINTVWRSYVVDWN